MTTVVDPVGTPVPVYTRSGTTVLSIAGSGTSQGAATSIPAVSGWTVAVLTGVSPDRAFKLPSSPQVGDVVEVHAQDQDGSLLFPSSGMAIGTKGTNQSLEIQNGGALLRYVDTNLWVVINGHGY